MERIIEAVENIADVIEHNYRVVTSGLPNSTSYSSNPVMESEAGQTYDDDEIYFEDEMESPLNGMADGVLKDAFSKHVGPQNAMEHLHAFRSAITWSEPFIIGLFCFHLVIILISIKMNRSTNFSLRMMFLLFVAGTIKSAEILNEYGRDNWEKFATQDYFDKGGVFVTFMFCVPLLLVCFFMMIGYLREAMKLVVEVKKMELRSKRQAKKKGNKKGDSKTNSKKSN